MNTLNTLSESQKLFVSLIVGFLVGVVVTALGFTLSGGATTAGNEAGVGLSMLDDSTRVSDETANGQESEEVVEVVVASGNSVMVNDQPAGSTVSIAQVSLSSSGWVAIHEVVDDTPTNILGAGRFDEGIAGRSITLLRGTESGRQYMARLYLDNGDGAFNPSTDPLIVDGGGQAIEDVFVTTQ